MDFMEFRDQITDFIFVDDKPVKSDIIFIPGNGFPQNAENAARLYHMGMAPYILPSGRFSITLGHFIGVQEKKELYAGDYETEWEFMKNVLMQNGVPENAILREDQATYTWDNAVRSREVLLRQGLQPANAILCCRNFHARRCLMYFQRAFPECEIRICPSVTEGITRDNWMTTENGVNMVTGEVQRIIHQFSLLMNK